MTLSRSGPHAFVIGDPIAHSKSPLIHGAWLERLGRSGSYRAIHVKPSALPTFIDRVREGAFAGGNVTIPHKETVLALVDKLTPAARTIGAVNTLTRAPDGTLTGDNTDHYGFLANLDDRAPNWDVRKSRALVLGAGGAARAVVHALAARGFEDLIILNRGLDRAAALTDAIAGRPAPLSEFARWAPEADLVVNTTAVGMGGTAFADLALDALPDHALVTDIVYTPLETPLLAAARRRKLDTADGLGMLLHQAVPGFAAWFGVRPEVDDALRGRVLAALEDG